MDIEAHVRSLLATGDARAAATAAMRGFGPRIYGYLRAVLRDDTDAGDAFSLFGENLWRGIATYRGEASFRTWAYRIAWNSALAVRDEAWRRHGRRFETGEASRLAEEIRTTAARVERQRTALDALRETLTAEEQTLLVLRIDQELSWDEIAHVLSADAAPVEAATLRKRFERLKERLGALARERGLVG
jgi:RNA polymerase sigma-70 factor (ECF subfamily)